VPEAVSARAAQAVVLALCAFAYVYVFPYQRTLNNPNENVRLYMTAALAESGTYMIDAQRMRWGWVNDAAVHSGHIYSVKAPGTSILGVPAYFVYLHASKALGHAFDRTEALWLCRVTGTILPFLWFAWAFDRFLRRRGYALALCHAALLSTVLGSLLYAYGMMFVSHSLSAAVAFGAFMLLYEARHGERAPSPLMAAGAGLLSAATTWFEYPGLIATLVLTVYALLALRTWRARAAFLLGGVPLALSMMHFQWRAFGNPFTPGHLFVENAAFRAAHEQGIYGAVGPSGAALYGLLFDLGAGLFPLTPLLIFAVPGSVMLCRDRARRADGICIAGVFLLTTLAISAMNNWRGGWTVGPRYLAVCVPFLAFAALPALEAIWERSQPLAAGLALGATAAGVVASGIPSAYYPHLPPELTRPLPQLFFVLIAHGFAPLNLSNLLGIYGTPSMLPWFACVAGAVLVAFASLSGGARTRALALALLTASLLLAPLCLRPPAEPGVRQAVAFITRRFAPAGHDRAARLSLQLAAAGAANDWERLRQLYTSEGRDREATAAARHQKP
jgi:hypothetical protein